MNESLVVFAVISAVTSLFFIRVAFKYYRANKKNYSNSKMSLLALGEYDRSFAIYMESKFQNMDLVTDPEMILFEMIIEFVSKRKKTKEVR